VHSGTLASSLTFKFFLYPKKGGPLVGDDVGSGKLDQKGSDCNPERLRFDFAWDDALSAAQLEQVEAIVNQQIADNYKVGV
jgi:hypothetical protein